MRAFILTSLFLLPLAAAICSTKCINNCFAEPELSMLAKSANNLFESRTGRRSLNSQRQEMCKHTESAVECLEQCKPSEQKDYFLASTVKWRQFGCNGTDEELQERVDLLESQLKCFNTREETLLIGLAGTLFVKGGNPARSEAQNLCDITSTLGRLVATNTECSAEAKATVMEFAEHAYRWVALKLGMDTVPKECSDFQAFTEGDPMTPMMAMQPDLFPESENATEAKDERWAEFHRSNFPPLLTPGNVFSSSTVCMQGCIQFGFYHMLNQDKRHSSCTMFEPIVSCFRDCPRNKLQDVTVEAGSFFCNKERRDLIDQCADSEEVGLPKMDEVQLRVVEQLLASGANSSVSAAENLCDMYTAVADPVVGPIKAFLRTTKDGQLAKACWSTYRGMVAATALPLRITALKLGISQDDIDCDGIDDAVKPRENRRRHHHHHH